MLALTLKTQQDPVDPAAAPDEGEAPERHLRRHAPDRRA